MNNIEKIEVKPNQYVWVDKDAEVEKGDLCYDPTTDNGVYSTVLRTAPDSYWNKQKLPKIIAASPELNLEEVPSYVEWLANKEYPVIQLSMGCFDDHNEELREAFIEGYQTAEKELQTEQRVKDLEKRLYDCSKTNADLIGKINELPTWEDVRKAIEMSRNFIKITMEDGYDEYLHTEEEIIEQLKQEKNEQL